jgi:hypothetical protein
MLKQNRISGIGLLTRIAWASGRALRPTKADQQHDGPSTNAAARS